MEKINPVSDMTIIRSVKLLVSIGLLVLFASPVFAAKERPHEKVANDLIRSGFSSGQAYSILTEFVKSAPHRQSGSLDAAKAVEWAKARMEQLGLSNVRLEPAMVSHWERGSINKLEIVSPSSARSGLNVIATGDSIPTPPEGVTAEVVEVRSKKELEDLGDKVKGKIVFFNHPMDRTMFNPLDAYSEAGWQRSRGPWFASKQGAVASISRSLTLLNNDIPYAGMLRYRDEAPPIPAANISTNDADRLSELIEKGPVVLRLKQNCKVLPKAESFNVIGEITGSKYPEQIVLIGAHLDNWDNTVGANDDGAGVAHTLEAMRLIKELGLKPERTIRAVLFMDEESGGLGGDAYAEKDRGKERHIAAIESDLGGAEPVGFTVEGKKGDYKKLKRWAYLFAPMNMTKFSDGDSGSDVWRLAKKGAVTIGMDFNTQKYFNYHHSPADTVDTINDRELESGAIGMATLAYVISEDGI